jgi:hypothetical protein
VSQLHPETLHLAVNLLDRYCSYRIDIDYELLGCVTLLIAAKYRDDRESTQKLEWMCCSLRDGSVLTRMEWNVLQELDWEVGHPTVADFQQSDLIASTKARRHPLLGYLSSYLAEIALYHREFISIRPSIMSSCTLALAHDILKCARPSDQAWIISVCDQVVYSLSTCLARAPAVPFNRYVRSRSSSLGTAIEMYLRGRTMLLLQAAAEVPTHGIDIAHIMTHDSGISYRGPPYASYGSCVLWASPFLHTTTLFGRYGQTPSKEEFHMVWSTLAHSNREQGHLRQSQWFVGTHSHRTQQLLPLAVTAPSTVPITNAPNLQSWPALRHGIEQGYNPWRLSYFLAQVGVTHTFRFI